METDRDIEIENIKREIEYIKGEQGKPTLTDVIADIEIIKKLLKRICEILK